ncbi:steroid 5-alpha-reductase DET2 [Diospyros lotus]|uniref:steroid 5-alpha-reductase DET2 n=1 Tax=Diospyros lotus TaxID=55363 RepID=UPI002250EB6F|nr:steroid 5-alpha-reductase DET2 [Diospyros lotus]XP_052204434.1 steroid 5-alpha-reductase DET2 [Diospyros lotus]XP_052204441.1 steroid 5-alpha-reductase DET2 [Diospyros lotus]XP_052204447.1 steroid 5-alpha-reductase DET2 [Diospyros lotus]
MGSGLGWDEGLFRYSLLSLLLAGPPTALSLRFLQAPYGKHHRPGWGPAMSPPLAWFFMESPTLWLTLLLFPMGRHRSNPQALILISPFLLHYLHRTCIYPLRLRRPCNGFPVTVALMAFVFNLWNSYVQARWVSHYASYENDRWFWVRFSGGLALFLSGMAVNVRSDIALVALKGKGEGGGGYQIPRGGWFELVSCPNYFGEVVEWLGWTVMTWSWAGLGFFLYTCSNLVPRAQAHHKWYLDKFAEDYPRGRKAVVPFVY